MNLLVKQTWRSRSTVMQLAPQKSCVSLSERCLSSWPCLSGAALGRACPRRWVRLCVKSVSKPKIFQQNPVAGASMCSTGLRVPSANLPWWEQAPLFARLGISLRPHHPFLLDSYPIPKFACFNTRQRRHGCSFCRSTSARDRSIGKVWALHAVSLFFTGKLPHQGRTCW